MSARLYRTTLLLIPRDSMLDFASFIALLKGCGVELSNKKSLPPLPIEASGTIPISGFGNGVNETKDEMGSTQRHIVVGLDNWVPVPESLAFPHTKQQYAITTAEQLPERMKDATIVIVGPTRITRAGIESAPDLRLIACNGTGTDGVDKGAARERGVAVCRVPAQNTDSVSEHAIALYFAIRRRIVELHEVAMDGITWTREKPNMRLGETARVCQEEVCVVIGYGALGRNIERLAKALGMTVLIAERKGALEVREGRTAFTEAIGKGTVFMFLTPLDDSTRNMISTAELHAMDPTALIVNVGRGGVIDETALIKALRDGTIGGAATDVFEREPATKDNSPLLDPTIPRLILSPHVAWYSSRTVRGTVETVKGNLEGFVAGRPQNIVVPGRENSM